MSTTLTTDNDLLQKTFALQQDEMPKAYGTLYGIVERLQFNMARSEVKGLQCSSENLVARELVGHYGNMLLLQAMDGKQQLVQHVPLEVLLGR